MDISGGDATEKELDLLITRRHDQRECWVDGDGIAYDEERLTDYSRGVTGGGRKL